MSTAVTPAAPLINLVLFGLIIGAMIGAALWLDRRIRAGERDPIFAAVLLARQTAFIHQRLAEHAAGEQLGGGAVSARGAGMLLALLGRFADMVFTAVEGHERRILWGLFALALVLRLAFLETLPGTITADELDFASDALRILRGQGPGLFGFDSVPQPAMSVHLIATSWRLFGVTIFAERLVAAVITACAILPFSLLLRRVVDPVPAMLATALFASSQWFLLFSRSGWTNGQAVSFMIFAAWALLRALDHQRLRDWTLFGVTLTLVSYGSLIGPVVVLALLVYLAVAVWRGRDGVTHGGWRATLCGGTLACFICALLFAPQLLTIVRDPAYASMRARSVLLFSASPGGDNPFGLVAQQLLRTIRSFILFDPSLGFGRYKGMNQRWLDPISALLFLGGLVVALRRRSGTGLWWLLFLLPLVLTQVLTVDSPNGARGLLLVAPMYFFVALALDALFRWPRLHAPATRAAIIGWSIILIVANVGAYAAWVNSNEAIVARQPAIQASDFYLWRDYQFSRLDAQEEILNVDDYNALPSATIAARVAAARDANAEIIVPQSAPARTDLGTEVKVFGDPGTGAGQLSEPRAVTVDSQGFFYVADAARKRVLKYAADGGFLIEWPLPEGLAQPWAIVATPDGTIVVLDAETSAIARFTADGAALGTAVPLDQPAVARGMALGLDGKLYLAQTSGSRVVTVSGNQVAGIQATVIEPSKTTSYSQPTSAVADARGFLFVYEPDNKRLRGFAASGQLRFTRSAPGTDTVNAGSLLILPDGRVALGDVVERRVLFYDNSGALLGSFAVSGLPQGLGVTPGGQLAVADRDGQRIRLYQLAAR
ncbi:MAG TPA: glycosyltransferase family 39 protein [Thermomicrobiales bacterium]